jgi:hypothetical protein
MSESGKRWTIWILLALAALLVQWLDRTHPLPVHVIRNGSNTVTAD